MIKCVKTVVKYFEFFRKQKTMPTIVESKVNEQQHFRLLHFACSQGLFYPIIIMRNNHGISLISYETKQYFL